MNLKKIIGDLFLLFIICIMIIPFLYMVITSLKVTYTAYDFSIGFDDLTLKNYIQILRNDDFFNFFKNSVIITFCGVILTLTFSSLAAYSFAKLKFKGSFNLFFYMLMTLIIPSQVTMIPLFIIMKHLGFINTYYGLILPIPTAFGVFLLRQAIINIPNDLIDSAKIDGCSDFMIFIKIILPLIKPSLIALSIFTFSAAWNEFLWPLIMTTNNDVRTLTVGLSILKTQYTVNYGLVMAGATITFMPSFLVYIILQSKFVKGITLTGVKG